MQILTERNKSILQAVIMGYIEEAEPVSSGTVALRYNTGVSPATIRNTMSELEEMGYLRQPHTSAGRIPTAKGFRFYVDSIIKLKELSSPEKKKIRSRYHAGGDIETLMKETSALLSDHSMCIGVALPPRFDTIIIDHIELIGVGVRQLMVIVISEAGIAHTKVVHVDDNLTQSVLTMMAEYLNNIAKGVTLQEVRKRVIKEMRSERRLYDKIIKKILQISDAVLKGRKDEEIYVEGRANILNQPDFVKDAEMLKDIFEAFERKSILLKFLDNTIEKKGVHIFIGSESENNEIKGLSLVTSTYGSGVYATGTVGVMGPMRMDYLKIIPIVDYIARLLSEILTEKGVS
ncbi:MAG: heat-inducible transcription repressor HrcA [Deltaproteobacteria bacterium GWC2_42_11]|nr:MAG: heat-inducible transcription repressor HrcA [Deltaproteobacteria bacterium GWC2_42_11]HBO83410.1 heat-inducible transcription repressor HrcA [Deltaproteobacteria bacterium]